MEKTFEEKFGLKTEEIEEILGGVVELEKLEEAGLLGCTSCLICEICTFCVSSCTLIK